MQILPLFVWRRRPLPAWAPALLLSFWTIARAASAEVSPILSGPREPVPAGQPAGIAVTFLNPTAGEMSAVFPARLPAHLRAGEQSADVTLEPVDALGVTTNSISPGGFARREYRFALPETLRGTAVLEIPSLATDRLALEVGPAEHGESVAGAKSERSAFARFFEEGENPRRPAYNPGEFFKQHFFGYEPFYFLAGTKSPNAKFQISLRYQIVNSEGPLAEKFPALKGLSVAYTQTSLWDWNAPSAPFLDSSYKPELLYLWQRVDRGRWADWVRLDLQGGVQHESNGKAGADSRSLNIAYLRPTLVLGRDNALQLTLSPRVWRYLPDLSDNPDLPDYRGYGDLRAIVGWQRGLQLSATGRLGDDGNHGSLQLDLTYPMMRLLSGSFSLYLHAQYFTGYGESFLLYNRRSDALRVGFSLYR